MYIPEKQYNLNPAEEMELRERMEREQELDKVLMRMENAKRRKRKTFYCGIAGFLIGVLYIIYVAMGIEWIDDLLYRLSGGNGIVRFILDFLPPVLLSGFAAFIIARKEKGVVTYIFSSISVFMVVLLVFLVYVSLMIR